jgi:ribosomal protein S18 acetylase RimI-like enzyme
VTTPRSIVWATSIDVLPADRVVERRDDHLVVRSPGNPRHYWGNYLLFDDPPRAGDGERWEALFAEAFAGEPRIEHRTFAWDRVDGAAGAADAELLARGYELDDSVRLLATAPTPHPRANREVEVRALDPDGDADLWAAVVELQVAARDEGHGEDAFRAFVRSRQADLRELFRAGRGAWYVAIDPPSGAVAGSLGVVVTAGRGRYQAVDTAEAFRRRGICSRLVVEAARRAAADHGAERFAIVADRDYHALGLYESLGFERAEHVLGVCRWPRA